MRIRRTQRGFGELKSTDKVVVKGRKKHEKERMSERKRRETDRFIASFKMLESKT